jgi:hypothetical protein
MRAPTITRDILLMHCASYTRHLGQVIANCLIAHGDEPVTTTELCNWAYGPGPHKQMLADTYPVRLQTSWGKWERGLEMFGL